MKVFSALTLALCFAAPIAFAATDDAVPTIYEADNATYNQIRQVATLTGHVKLDRGPQHLTADTVTYDRVNDVVTATGNVVFTDTDGSVHKGNHLELSEGMKRGFVNQLKSVLPDGGRVRAEYAQRLSADQYAMKRARYTSCAPCAGDPEGDKPAWDLQAKQVDFDDAKKTATYHNAWLNFYGLPVLYTPWFRHSYADVTQKSGLLSPRVGWSSKLGGFYEQRYYFGLAPDQDATLGVLASTNYAPVLTAEYRKRFDNASILLNGSGTRSSRTDTAGTQTITTNDEWRGHLYGDALWNVNDLWRAGAQLRMVSDPQYLRQYRFQSQDVLTNRVYAERFEGRNYATADMQLFQDLRVGTDKVDQPGVLPHASFSYLGNAGEALGGRWALDGDFLNLFREGSGQDVSRLSGTAGWERRDVLPLGLLWVNRADIRGDLYVTRDRVAAALDPTKSNSNKQGRAFPTVQTTLSYPLQKRLAHASLRVAPQVALTATPNLNNNSSIPNEDSEDVQIDAWNLFNANRFPGYDRVEDRSHVAYGIRTGYYGDNGDQFSVFAGQSRQLSGNSDNPFPANSGLSESKSDYVGDVTVAFGAGAHVLNYKSQYDGNTGRSKRHEVYGATTMDRLTASTTYLYARGTDPATAPTREQIAADVAYKFTDDWRFHTGTTYEIARQEKGLRRFGAGFDYTHECYSVSLSANREVAKETSGGNQMTFMFEIGLKNIGKFSTGNIDAPTGH